MSERYEPIDDLSGIGKPEAAETREKPFKFLDPYTIEDQDIFFGRDDEIKAIYKRFYSSRILLVYGESGSGKTSLVQCGLRSKVLPEDVHFITVRAAIDPLNALQKELLKITDFSADAVPSSSVELLKEAALINSKTIGLIFDQFEEFFTCQSDSFRKKFISKIKDWLAENLDIRIIICIREDYYARMTEMEASIPQIYQNRLWVRRMSREQVRDVIVKPCEKCGVSIEDKLIEKLSDVMTKDGKGADLPILQVVLDTLYNDAFDKSPESPALTLASYQEMGDIESILSWFVKDRISRHNNPEQFRQVLKTMITRKGTKRMVSEQDIAEQSALFGESIPQNELSSILDELSKDRIIMKNSDNHLFELRHDALANVIFQWMTGIEQEIMKVRQDIEIWFEVYQRRKKLIDKSDLEYIALYERRLWLKTDVKAFIEQSKREAQKKRRRMMTFAVTASAILVLVISGLSIFGYMNLIQTRYNLGIMFNEKAQREVEHKNFNAARLYALHALDTLNKVKNTDAEKSLATGILISYPDCPILHPEKLQHDQPVKTLSFSPDGKILASGAGNDIWLWNVETGENEMMLTGHSNAVESVSFSPDGKTLASGAKDKTIRIWNVKTGIGSVLAEYSDSVFSVDFSPDGKILASGSADKTIRLWDMVTNKELKTLDKHAYDVIGVKFAPNGKFLASGAWDCTIRLWNMTTYDSKEFPVDSDLIFGIDFSPDGKTLVVGTANKIISLFDVITIKEKQSLAGHSDKILSVRFSPIGNIIASGSKDKTIRLWDIATSKEKALLTGHTDDILSLEFSPDGKILASGSKDKNIFLWNIEKIGKDQLIGGQCVNISSDGKTIAVGGYDSDIHLWDMKNRKELSHLTGHSGSVRSVSFSPNGKILASGSNDKTIRLWDIENGKEKLLFPMTDTVHNVSFSPNGIILAGTCGKTIHIWDVETRQERKRFEEHKMFVQNINFSHNSKILASGSIDKTIRLWDIETLKELSLPMTEHSGAVHSVSFSNDDKILVSGSDDNTMRLWDVANRKYLKEFAKLEYSVRAVSFSPDGKTLASGSNDKTIRLWNFITGKEKAVLKGHEASVYNLFFSPDGKTLISGAYDNTIRLWDLSWLDNPLPIQEQIKEAEKRYKMKLVNIELQ